MTDLITVGSYIDRQEAEMAKGILEEKGINCFITSDDLAGLRPHLTLTSQGVLLVVTKKDLHKAQQALEILNLPVEDYQEDKEFESFKLSQNAKSFHVLVLLTIANAFVGCWFLWHSLSLTGNAKLGITVAGVAFLLLAAVGIIPCRTTYNAREAYKHKNR